MYIKRQPKKCMVLMLYADAGTFFSCAVGPKLLNHTRGYTWNAPITLGLRGCTVFGITVIV